MLKNSAESVSLTIMVVGHSVECYVRKRLGSIGLRGERLRKTERFYDMSRNVTRPEGSLQAFLCLEAG